PLLVRPDLQIRGGVHEPVDELLEFVTVERRRERDRVAAGGDHERAPFCADSSRSTSARSSARSSGCASEIDDSAWSSAKRRTATSSGLIFSVITWASPSPRRIRAPHRGSGR